MLVFNYLYLKETHWAGDFKLSLICFSLNIICLGKPPPPLSYTRELNLQASGFLECVLVGGMSE